MPPDQSQDSHTIEEATTAILPSPVQPDSKTRRYDRQLRLWAASGQSALESSRVLVIGGSATSTSILKNLVLPGIGHFTILDDGKVTNEDAGNNFFLVGLNSVGKMRAEEEVRLLTEMNEDVTGEADTRNLEDVLSNDPDYFTSFNLIIAHNLQPTLLKKLSTLIWSHGIGPSLIVVKSSGFIAEFFIQFHHHTVVDSHSDNAPSLRIDKPFPALLEHALSLDLEQMDDMEHSHIPYVVILVRAIEEWKKVHDGKPPQTYAEKQEFKKFIDSLRRKVDEENFDEAIAQAYRAWTPTTVPSTVSSLFSDPYMNLPVVSLDRNTAVFFHLLCALKRFVEEGEGVLPLSATVPDMKSDTKSYVGLQRLYKARADEEKEGFRSLVGDLVHVDGDAIDEFVKNAHGLRLLKGRPLGELDQDKEALVNLAQSSPKELATHLALSALSLIQEQNPNADAASITAEKLTEIVYSLSGADVWEQNEEAQSALEAAVGEVARAPHADLPNTAAFLGGLVAQEAIKMITRQYVPVKGYCVVDLVGMWTGVVDA